MIDNTIKISLEEMYKSDKYKDCFFYFRKPKTSELMAFNQAQVDLQDTNAERATQNKTLLEATPELAVAMESLIANTYVKGTMIGDNGIEELSKEQFESMFLDVQTVGYLLPIMMGVEGLDNLKQKSDKDLEQTK